MISLLFRPDRVDVLMAVEPAGLAMGVTQSDLAAMDNDLGLTTYNGAETALKAGLELRCHEAVMGPSLGQDGKVQPEEAKVEQGGDDGDQGQPGGGICQQLAVREVMPGNLSPEVLGQQKQAEEARVDPDILDTESRQDLID